MMTLGSIGNGQKVREGSTNEKQVFCGQGSGKGGKFFKSFGGIIRSLWVSPGTCLSPFLQKGNIH